MQDTPEFRAIPPCLGDRRRTQVIQPDGQYFTYAYDGASRLLGLYQGADTSVVLDSFSYNAQGLPATRTERYGSSVTYGFDNVTRLTSQADVLLGTGGNVNRTFGYSPASQMTSRTPRQRRLCLDGRL